ncbi:hypothetical protein [Kordiimonas marina]|uniref:hypothetical protein n=1 Tax=Kordiimonas marina TaxID=2872312 RepID=UPI001FF5B148|nr:hypothetical protein [Kordiimonas marina]MCJ9428491.1 hypothetical protein [Kordiimonas marina]
MTMTAPLPDDLMTSPALYPFQVDWKAEKAWMLMAPDGWYDAAAFLDQRALTKDAKGDWVPLDALEVAAADAPARPLGLIFHVGHCGSTLISRALGLVPGFFSLREPLPFRDLAALQAETGDMPTDKTDLMRAFWARPPDKDALATVKATSFCSLMAKDWLTRYTGDRAVMLAMAPEIYIATVLGADAYVADLKGGAAIRTKALTRATGAAAPAPDSLTAGELAAMTYMAELINLHLGVEAADARALRLDFDGYLKDPAATLATLAQHFGRDISTEDAARLLSHPILGRYSKATDYRFTAGDRKARLTESRAKNGAEITRGIDWIRALARAHPVAREALIAYGYAR